MIRYVLGLAFYADGSVLLLKKTHPEWQEGRYNFVGGKVLEGEDPRDAMLRKLTGETGLTEEDVGELFVLGRILRRDDFEVTVFVFGVISDRDPVTPDGYDVERVRKVGPDEFTISSELRGSMVDHVATLWHFSESQDFVHRDATITIEVPSKEDS
jgi:ADP-ribose pyrophosphatase YjhB (NUDIX family)